MQDSWVDIKDRKPETPIKKETLETSNPMLTVLELPNGGIAVVPAVFTRSWRGPTWFYSEPPHHVLTNMVRYWQPILLPDHLNERPA